MLLRPKAKAKAAQALIPINVMTYLAHKGENEVVDRDFPIQSQCKANQKDQVMHKYGRNPPAI